MGKPLKITDFFAIKAQKDLIDNQKTRVVAEASGNSLNRKGAPVK
jgi:hypothetical protein